MYFGDENGQFSSGPPGSIIDDDEYRPSTASSDQTRERKLAELKKRNDEKLKQKRNTPGMMQPNDMKRPGTRGGTRPKSGRQGGYKSVATDTPGASVNVAFDPDGTLLASDDPPTTFLPPPKMSDTERKLRDKGIPAQVESSDEDDLESSPLPSPTTTRSLVEGSSPLLQNDAVPTKPINTPEVSKKFIFSSLIFSFYLMHLSCFIYLVLIVGYVIFSCALSLKLAAV